MDVKSFNFLKDTMGRFDLPALLVSLTFGLAGSGLILQIVKAWRSGRIRFIYSGRYSRAIDVTIERAARPYLFWFLFIAYFVGSCVFLVLSVMACFGLLRNI